MAHLNKYIAEIIGTFALVFAGTGAIVVNDLSGGVVTHVGIALTFGLVVMAMIYAVGDISGAHFNPAVTLGFWLARRLPGRAVAPYIAAQCTGAILASILIKLIFVSHLDLGATFPHVGVMQSFVLEVVISFFLMFVILAVSQGAKETGLMAGVAVGGVVALAALALGPVCGASMNPARSLGPALVSGTTAGLWIYIAAPVTGASLAVAGCRCVRQSGCCTASA